MIKGETNFKLFPELLLLFLRLLRLLGHHLCILADEFQTWMAAEQNNTVIHGQTCDPHTEANCCGPAVLRRWR